jgi:hypothetical protein
MGASCAHDLDVREQRESLGDGEVGHPEHRHEAAPVQLSERPSDLVGVREEVMPVDLVQLDVVHAHATHGGLARRHDVGRR